MAVLWQEQDHYITKMNPKSHKTHRFRVSVVRKPTVRYTAYESLLILVFAATLTTLSNLNILIFYLQISAYFISKYPHTLSPNIRIFYLQLSAYLRTTAICLTIFQSHHQGATHVDRVTTLVSPPTCHHPRVTAELL